MPAATTSAELLSRTDGAAFRITLNRPDRRNAITPDLAALASDAIAGAQRIEGVRAIILAGAGGHFCAGLDLRWFAERAASLTDSFLGKGLARFQNLVRAVTATPLPVIAELEGSVAGFGLDLALACDLRIAGEGTTFTSAFARMGLVPDGGSTFTLPRLVGAGRAFRVLAGGESLDADAALRAGLVEEVAPAGAVSQRALALAETIAQNAAGSVTAIKRLLRGHEAAAIDAALTAEGEAQRRALAGREFRERLSGFLDKGNR